MNIEERKKILAISYLFPNSEKPNHGIFVYNRLNAMAKYADVTVINPIPWSPLHSFIDKFKHLRNIPAKTQRGNLTIYHPRYLSIPGYAKGIEIPTYRSAVKKVINEIGFDFDLIDLHWTFPDLPTGDYLRNRFGVPYRVTLRGIEAFHIQDGDVRQASVAQYLNKVGSIISLSTEMANQAISMGVNPEKVTVIRNGVDTEVFFYKPLEESRALLNLPKERRIVLGVGSLIHRKGFDVVIKAMAEIESKEKLFHFYILGSEGPEGDYRSELKKLVREKELENFVHFVGAVPNETLVDWYNAADVFCLSSRGEGSPNVLTEALACGCPAVSTNVGSAPDIMESEKDLGVLVGVDDSLNIGNALLQLLAEENDRRQRAEVFGKYTWDWCAKQTFGE